MPTNRPLIRLLVPSLLAPSVLAVVLWAACAGDPDWESLNEAAKAAHAAGDVEAAERGFERALERAQAFPPDDPRRVISHNNLGQFLRSRDRLAEALPHFARAVELRVADPAVDRAELIDDWIHLAGHAQNAGAAADAERYWLEALALLDAVAAGPDAAPRRATVLNNLGMFAYMGNRPDEAEARYVAAIETMEGSLLKDHPDLGIALNNLGQLRVAQGRLEEATDLFERSVRIGATNLGANAPAVARIRMSRAEALQRLKRYPEAEAEFRRALASLEAHFGDRDSPDVAKALNGLGVTARLQNRPDEALEHYGRSIEILERLTPQGSPDLGAARFNMARLIAERGGRDDDALVLFEQAMITLEATLGPDHPNLAIVYTSYADLLDDVGQGDRAASLRERAAELR